MGDKTIARALMSFTRVGDIISLRRYLDRAEAPADPPASSEPLLKLASGICDGIQQHVLCARDDIELQAEFSRLRERLSPALGVEEAKLLNDEISNVLFRYSTSAQKKSAALTVQVQHILSILNQALLGVANGSQRSMTRLQKIQESLQKTSLMQDMTALKACLSETMQYVREESQIEKQAASKELDDLEREFGKAREFATASQASLPGRPEGVRHIARQLRGLNPDLALYLLAYRLDRLQALAQRYGASAGEELIFHVIHDRVYPLANGSVSFRWTPSSLVAVFERARNLAAVVAEAKALNRSPLQCRLSLGNRTAILTVQPSHLVAEAA